jgi:hypothetical protein
MKSSTRQHSVASNGYVSKIQKIQNAEQTKYGKAPKKSAEVEAGKPAKNMLQFSRKPDRKASGQQHQHSLIDCIICSPWGLHL